MMGVLARCPALCAFCDWFSLMSRVTDPDSVSWVVFGSGTYGHTVWGVQEVLLYNLSIYMNEQRLLFVVYSVNYTNNFADPKNYEITIS